MAHPQHVRSASPEFWLSSIHQQLAVLAALTDRGKKGRGNSMTIDLVDESVRRLVALSAGATIVFSSESLPKSHEKANDFRTVVSDFAANVNETTFKAVMSAFKFLDDELFAEGVNFL